MRPRRRHRAPAAIAAALISGAPLGAAAADGVYGRFDGDLELRVQAGAAIAAGRAQAVAPSLAAGISALYLGTAGIYTHYTDALGGAGPVISRSIAAGIHLQPLFLGRWASNLERGPAHLDLFIDSFTLQIGAFWSAPQGKALRSEPGAEVALALAVPFFPRATGLFLGVRGALRFRAEDTEDRPGPLARSALLSITLEWHHVLPVHLVDAGDRAPR